MNETAGVWGLGSKAERGLDRRKVSRRRVSFASERIAMSELTDEIPLPFGMRRLYFFVVSLRSSCRLQCR